MSNALPGSGISGPFIRHPIGTSLIMAGIVFLGIVAYPFLPVAPLPQVDFPTIQVSAQLPGADPETMAATVAQPLETQFAQMPGVAQLTSQSSLGQSQITIQFDLDRNIDGAANDVQAAINAAGGQLPKTLPNPPTFRKVNPADAPIMILSATSETLPIITVNDEVNTKLAQQISQLTGVSQVSIGGQQKPAIRIQVDPAKLASRGMTLEDVRAQIAIVTVAAAKGSIDTPDRSYTVYANDQLLDAKLWNDVIISYRNGAPVRIRDIGRAVAGPEDAKQLAWADGKRGVFLVVFKQPGANVIDTVERVKAQLPRLTAAIPAAIEIKTLSDRTTTIRAAVAEVQKTLLETVVLVVIVIFVFLRNFWATIIPAITVPLSLLGACAAMWVCGYSLDNISLLALTISVGFVVDDAIVMLENISRYIEEGESPMKAALHGAGEIGFTIVSISLSLIAVLIPLLLMGGIIGRLFREFAVVLAITIAISGFVALTLTPTMAARLLHRESEVQHGRLYRWSERAFDAILNSYTRGLDVVLRFRFLTLLTFFLTLGATVYLFTAIPKGFFPQQDTGLITGISEGPQDVSFQKMVQLQEALGDIVRADPAVDTIAMAIGGSGGTAINNGRMFITLKPREQRDVSADRVIARLRPKLEEVQGARLYLQAAQDVRMGGRSSRTQYQYTLQDADLAELSEWSPKVLAKLQTLAEVRDVATDQQVAGTTLQLTIDRDQASRFGIQPQQIDDTLYNAFGQRQITQYFTQTNSYRVILEVTPDLQGAIGTLNRLYVRAPVNGTLVPLSTFVHWTNAPVRPLSISHQGQFAATTISFNLANGVALGQATAAIEKAMGDLGAPQSLTGSFQGTAQAFQQSLSSVPLLILAALVVVYLILGVLYESYIHPITILSTLPSAGLGALATLMLFGYDFSLVALIGVILLIGIVKKNGIMLVDFAIVAERDGGMSPVESIRQAAILRFRPILMTTMAALLGAVPLMLGHGTGSEIREPLGFSMFGGLIVSQLLTLFTTPVIYLYLDDLSRWLSRAFSRREEAPALAPPREQIAAE